MPCPQPLDPLCVAILLRLNGNSMSSDDIARDLRIDPSLICERIDRLSAINAVTSDASNSAVAVCPDAFRIILEATESGNGLHRAPASPRRTITFDGRLQRLQQDPMLQSLPYEELRWIAQVSRTQEFRPGEILLLEGDACQGLYLVDSGTIRLSKGSTSGASGFGREQTIRLMGPGDSFNEVPVFDGKGNPVTAEAVETSRVIVVPRQELMDLVGRNPEFSRAIIVIMAKRLRHMLAMIEDVSMRDVTGRVAKILLQVVDPSEGVGAGLRSGRKLTQREIAEMAGTAREVVARALKKLEQAGAISVNRGDVRILDAERLKSFT